jgi:uncharacterized membrane protein YfcA
VDWGLLGTLLLGSIPGIWLGAQLTRKLPERLVRALLCVALVTAGLKVIH